MQGAMHGCLDHRIRTAQCGTASQHQRLCSAPGRRLPRHVLQPCLSDTASDAQPSSSAPQVPEDAEARRLRRQALRQTRQAVAAPAPGEQQAQASTEQDQPQSAATRTTEGASTSTSTSAAGAAATPGGKSRIGNRRAAARARTSTPQGQGSSMPASTPSSEANAASAATGPSAVRKPKASSRSRPTSTSKPAREAKAASAPAAGRTGTVLDSEEQDQDGPFGMAAADDDVTVDGGDAADDGELLWEADAHSADVYEDDSEGDEEEYEDGAEDDDDNAASTSGGSAVEGLESSAAPKAKKKEWRPTEQMVLKESHPMYVPVLTDDDLAEDPPGHKSGYVAIIGRPNAGKSTLINAIVGQKLSIVTFKAQTTRHRVVGIASEPAYQMILFDTPGIVRQQRNALEERMMAAVVSSIRAAEAIIAVVDAGDEPKEALAMFQPGSDWNGPPMSVLLNKADLLAPEELEELSSWYKTNCRAEQVFTGSALTGSADEAVAAVKAWAVEKMPEGPTLYPKDMISEQPERFFVSEIIREKIFLNYEQEIPYCVQVTIPEFKERPGQKDYISATILVERDTQKGIIIGVGGAAIKKLGAAARTDIEAFLERPVYLELRVEVAPDWRNKNESLKSFGFYDPLYIT